jgi:hypothetical protein
VSRSGYSKDCENVQLWRGNVERATRGKRGQAFFINLVAALDAMPVKRLVANELQTTAGEVCTLGALNRRKGGDAAALDAAINGENYGTLGEAFDIPGMLAQETMYVNDEGGPVTRWRCEGGGWVRDEETAEARWARIRAWAAKQIKEARVTHRGSIVIVASNRCRH